jgi:hypothetical protein
MDIDGTEWITLREAEQVIGRSRRQIWRYIYDGSWDTRAVMDDMNRQVTYVQLNDILRKKTKLESSSAVDVDSLTEKGNAEGVVTDEASVEQLLQKITSNQEYQNNLIKKCLYLLERTNPTYSRIFMLVILFSIIIVAVCSIISVLSATPA